MRGASRSNFDLARGRSSSPWGGPPPFRVFLPLFFITPTVPILVLLWGSAVYAGKETIPAFGEGGGKKPAPGSWLFLIFRGNESAGKARFVGFSIFCSIFRDRMTVRPGRGLEIGSPDAPMLSVPGGEPNWNAGRGESERRFSDSLYPKSAPHPERPGLERRSTGESLYGPRLVERGPCKFSGALAKGIFVSFSMPVGTFSVGSHSSRRLYVLLPATATACRVLMTALPERATSGPVPARRACTAITSACTAGTPTRATTATGDTAFRSVASSFCRPSVRFPASGLRYAIGGGLHDMGSGGYYWFASPLPTAMAVRPQFTEGLVYPSGSGSRSNGFPVRCVQSLQTVGTEVPFPASATAGTERIGCCCGALRLFGGCAVGRDGVRVPASHGPRSQAFPVRCVPDLQAVRGSCFRHPQCRFRAAERPGDPRRVLDRVPERLRLWALPELPLGLDVSGEHFSAGFRFSGPLRPGFAGCSRPLLPAYATPASVLWPVSVPSLSVGPPRSVEG